MEFSIQKITSFNKYRKENTKIMKEKNVFSLRLKSLRERKGLSQSALAKKIGVTKSTIYRYENSDLMPTLYNAVLLAQVLDTTLDYLVGMDDVLAIKLKNLKEDQIEWLMNTVDIYLREKTEQDNAGNTVIE